MIRCKGIVMAFVMGELVQTFTTIVANQFRVGRPILWATAASLMFACSLLMGCALASKEAYDKETRKKESTKRRKESIDVQIG